MDPELQEVFNYVVSTGVNLFDTADSYGERKGGDLQFNHAPMQQVFVLSLRVINHSLACLLQNCAPLGPEA